jgi:integrase
MASRRGFVKRRGATWTAYWKIDTADGLRQRTKGGFATRKEAQAYLTTMLVSIQTGRFTEPSKLTLTDYLVNRWLPSRKASLKESTFDTYDRAVRLHVIPALGHLRLQNIGPEHLDALYADMLAAGAARKSVRNVHAIMHKALRDAMRKDLVIRNVADAADAPRQPRPGENEMKTWTAEQVKAFFAAIKDHRLAVAYTLAVATGMRRGEVLGLRWGDLDLSKRRLVVAHTILSVNYKITEGTPKTVRGRRSMVLDDETVKLLTEYRKLHPPTEHRTALGRDLVFTRDDGGPIHPDYFSQTFERTVKKLHLPRIRLHDLRHTNATLGLAAGIPVKVISERLGHATTSFTQDVYIHAIPALEEDAADRIGKLLFDRSADELEDEVHPDDDPTEEA